MAQAIPTFFSHWKDTEAQFGVYFETLMLFLTCGACAFAWARNLRGFVLLALASQGINGFIQLGRVVYYLTLLGDAQRDTVHFHHEFIGDLIALVFASAVVIYVTPRYLSVRELASGEISLPWSKDLVLLRWVFLVASLISTGQAILMVVTYSKDTTLALGVYYQTIMLLLTWGVCALAWAKRLRGFVLLAIASRLIDGFVTLGFVLMDGTTLFRAWPAMPRHLLRNVTWDLVIVVFASTLVVYLTSRYLSVRKLPPSASAQS